MTTTRHRHPVSITTTYWIPTEPESITTQFVNNHSTSTSTSHVFATTRHATLGLRTSSDHHVPTKPPAGSFTYSGMHDQGPLVPPREGGDMAILIACCEDAKAHTDEYLTQVMANHDLNNISNTNNISNNMEDEKDRQAKKTKMEEEEK